MPWFKVDDAFAFHPKRMAAGPQAVALWVVAGSWCAQQLTDGVVPTSMVPALGGRLKDARDLVTAGLWHIHPDGFMFHDWSEYQPTRDSVLTERAQQRERQRARRAARTGGVRTNNDGTTHGVRDAFVTPDPTRPEDSLSVVADINDDPEATRDLRVVR